MTSIMLDNLFMFELSILVKIIIISVGCKSSLLVMLFDCLSQWKVLLLFQLLFMQRHWLPLVLVLVRCIEYITKFVLTGF